VEVQALQPVEGLVEGGNGFSLEGRVEPAAGVDVLDLFQCQVGDFVGVEVGVDLFDVGGAFQGRVVHEHGFAVGGELDVDLDGLGAQFVGGVDGGEGVLGCVPGGSAVGDGDERAFGGRSFRRDRAGAGRP